MEQFHEAQNWLVNLSSEAQFFREGKAPTLQTVNLFLDALERPDESFAYRVVVGGTAGKGTVCRTVEDVLLRSGKKVATLLSPHVQVVTERIRLNGQLIAPGDFAKYVFQIKDVMRSLHTAPTFYEVIVLAGILAARDAGCEILICEVGLGGGFDAVNAVQGPRIAAVTFIGDDHKKILGGTLEHIAKTKAGIFTKDSVLNVSGEKVFQKILESVAKGPVKFVKGIPAKLNKKVAREICEYVLNIPSPCGRGTKGEGRKETPPSPREIVPTLSGPPLRGISWGKVLPHKGGGGKKIDFEMQKLPIPARWEKIPICSEIATLPMVARDDSTLVIARNAVTKQSHRNNGMVILEGAHSAPRFEYISPKIKKITGKKIGVFAMARNHDPKTFQIILPEFEEVIWTTVPGVREFWKPEELLKLMGRGRVEKNPIGAFRQAQTLGGKVIVTGSFYLCGVIRDLFYAPEKILEQRTEFPT